MFGRIKSARFKFYGKSCEVWRILEFFFPLPPAGTICEMVLLDMLWIFRALISTKQNIVFYFYTEPYLFICIFHDSIVFLLLFFALRFKSFLGYSTIHMKKWDLIIYRYNDCIERLRKPRILISNAIAKNSMIMLPA